MYDVLQRGFGDVGDKVVGHEKGPLRKGGSFYFFGIIVTAGHSCVELAY